MSVKNLVFGEVKINYDGPFDLNNLYALIQNYFYNKKYDFTEIMDEEMATAHGKSILLDMLFDKKYTTYYRGEILVKLRMNNIIPIILDGQNIFQGDINIKVKGMIESDYDQNWDEIKKERYNYKEKKRKKETVGTLRWLFHFLANKFFYKRYYDQYCNWVKRDANEMLEQVRSFLNTYNLKEKSKL